MRSVGTSASDVSRFNGEVQDFLAAGASFSRRPDGLKNMRVKIVVKNHILLESLKYLFKFGNAIFRSSESFDGTRFVVGSALLISSEDMAVHLSRVICVIH